MFLEDSYSQAIEMADRMEQRSADLKTLGAPSDLMKRAKNAVEMMRNDLSRLAELMAAPSNDRSSGVVSTATDLYSFATENAVDGCFEEFYAFTESVSRVSNSAALPVLRQMAQHAQVYSELCWDINDWCLSQLSPQRGRNIRATQHDAVRRLASSESAPILDPQALEQLERRIDGRVVAA